MNYLLSIIIPTKNRYNTLIPVLDYLLSIESRKMEIVVHDNSDDNAKMQDYIKDINDSRLNYIFSDEQLSQTENSNLAVINSIGEYICFIGDDDGVMPYIVSVAEWMRNNNIDAIKAYKPNYSWPGLRYSYLASDESGVLTHNKFNYKIRVIKTNKAIKKLLFRGGTDISQLPCLYHGIVSKKSLNMINKKTGSYFPGPSPDMANAVSLGLCIASYTYLDFPVVISGKSSTSIGGQGVLHKHISKIEEVPHLPKETKAIWTDKIPKYWTGPTIWAESVIKALEANGKEERINDLNFPYLYAKIMVFNFTHRKQIFNNFPYKIYTPYFFYSFSIQFIKRLLLFSLNKLKLNGIKSQVNIKDIGEAIFQISKEVDKNRLPF